MRNLYNEGAYLVIISNQKGVNSNKCTWQDVDAKIQAILDRLDFLLILYVLQVQVSSANHVSVLGNLCRCIAVQTL